MILTAVLGQSWLQESGVAALGHVGDSSVAQGFGLLFRGLGVADGVFATLSVGSRVDKLEALAEGCRSAEGIDALSAGDVSVLDRSLVRARLAQHVGVGELGYSGGDLEKIIK
jgi:hypothetical protein